MQAGWGMELNQTADFNRIWGLLGEILQLKLKSSDKEEWGEREFNCNLPMKSLTTKRHFICF